MNTELLLQQLFPHQLDYQIEGYVIKGNAQTDAGPVRIFGTVNAAPINQQIAIQLSSEILKLVQQGNKHLWSLLWIRKVKIFPVQTSYYA
jgi:malonate decarboxylase gamma subunit